jgi:putative transposase
MALPVANVTAVSQTEERPMDEQTVRKTYQYKLQPTAEQAGAMACVLRRCRELYNAGLQERRDAWQQCGVSITAASQSAQLPAIKDVRPEEYRDVHSQVLQDVLARLDRAFGAFFRRVKRGETPGYPRFHGATRYHSFTYQQVGNGATLDPGVLVLSKLGRSAVRTLVPPAGGRAQAGAEQPGSRWVVRLLVV